MQALIALTIRALFKARQTPLFALILCLLLATAGLASELSARQPQVVTLDLGLSFIRFTMPLLVIFFGFSQFATEMDKKSGASTILAFPISRSQYLLARYIGLALSALFLMLPLGFLLWVCVKLAGLSFTQGTPVDLGLTYFVALIGIWLESCVVLAALFLFATLSTSTAFSLFSATAYWWIARSVSAVRSMLAEQPDLMENAKAISQMLDQMQWLLPDLQALDWRAPTLYNGHWQLLNTITIGNILMNAVFIVLALSLASWRFQKLELA